MARFNRIDVATAMYRTGIVPIFYHPDPEVCLDVARACYRGGIRVFEFTNRGDFAHEVFSSLNKSLSRELPEMILGAGSVVDAGTASLYIQLGANFIVSPLLREEMAYVCNRRKILWSPGCGSVTEISRAEELGAEIVKIFPGSSIGGPGFVKALKGPCPWSRVMPTGGVDPSEENLKAWFDAGVACVGMGSKMITKEIVRRKDYERLERIAAEAVNTVRKLRNENKG